MTKNLNYYINRISDPKELLKDWENTSCKEIIHPHVDSCSKFFLELWSITFKNGLSVYTPMYLITTSISTKSIKQIAKKAIPAIIRSSLFLSLYTALYQRLLCYFINKLGHTRFVYWLAPFISSFITLYIEKAQRRRELSVFMVNQGAENMFKLLYSRGYLTYYPFETGKKIIFAISVAVLMYFFKWERENMSPSIRSLIKALMAPEVILEKNDWLENHVERFTSPLLTLKNITFGNDDPESRERKALHKLNFDSKKLMFWVNGFVRGFTIGYFSKATLSLVSKIFKPKRFLNNWKKVLIKSFGRDTLRFACFVSLLVGIPRMTKIFLLSLINQENKWIDIISGLTGGIATYIYSSTEFTMYLLSKALESLVYALIDRKILPSIPIFESIIYSIGAATLFYSGSWEPWTLRPSYRNFVAKCSGEHYARFSESDGLRSLRIKSGMEKLHQNYLKFKNNK